VWKTEPETDWIILFVKYDSDEWRRYRSIRFCVTPETFAKQRIVWRIE